MSVKVGLADLADSVAGYTTVPMLLTTDGSSRPRASAVLVEWDGTDVVVRAGRRSVANAEARPLVSLLWPAAPGQSHALLVDGDAVAIDTGEGTVRFQPTSAILHVVDQATVEPGGVRHC
jgi:hypothetical protein